MRENESGHSLKRRTAEGDTSAFEAMVRLNRTRMDYLERFQTMIDAYNVGSLNSDEFFQQVGCLCQQFKKRREAGRGRALPVIASKPKSNKRLFRVRWNK